MDIGTVIAIALLMLAAFVGVRLIVRRIQHKSVGCSCGCAGCAVNNGCALCTACNIKLPDNV